jgi:LPXTG-site transpeptidase (sortase) family protein
MGMRRALNIGGTALMVAGIITLIYVAVSYIREGSVSAPGWGMSQQQQGKELASKLAKHQKLAIPKNLQHTVAPGSEQALRIAIPKISVNSPVVQSNPTNGVWDVADWAVGHLTTTPNPGAAGNGAYSAHDDIKGEIFKRLGELTPGDEVLLYTKHAVYTYTVDKQLTVDPSDIKVLDPTRLATISLITCTPYWIDTQRLVVQAVLKSARSV